MTIFPIIIIISVIIGPVRGLLQTFSSAQKMIMKMTIRCNFIAFDKWDELG